MKNLSVTVILVVASTALGYIATKNFNTARMEKNLALCKKHLADIEGAKDQYALEHEGKSVTFIEELVPVYLDEIPQCPAGGAYTLGDSQTLVTCTVEGHRLDW